MELDRIHFYLDNSTTLKLLKSEYASLAVGFFFHAFKKNYRNQISETELSLMLEEYLQHDLESAKSFQGKMTVVQFSERLLGMWSDDKHRFLRKYYDFDSDTPIVELTYDTERALEWMESLDRKEFVGTHSRFFVIFQNLKTIVEQTQKDPQVRLKYLEEKRKELNYEIKEIQTTGVYKTMDSTQVKERFLNLIDDSRRLISDFGLVEEIFKELTQKIKEKKLIEFANKGQILGEILDAYDYLEDSDQGKSFNAFWDFLMSSDQQHTLNDMIQQVLNAEEIKSYLVLNPIYGTQLKKLKSNLLQVGKKVLHSKLRLSEELRKLLHQQSLLENKHVMEEVAQIKKCFIENRAIFLALSPKDFIEISFLPEVYLPMERPLWSPEIPVSFSVSRHLYGTCDFTEDQILDLRQLFYVDKKVLQNRVLDLLKNQPQVTLREVVNKHPIEKGVAEVLLYFELAQENNYHIIKHEINEIFKFKTESGEGKISIPQLIFLNGSEN